MGMDSDDPMCLGEVGKVGVAIDSIEDMETVFRDIPLGRISTSMTINASAVSFSQCTRALRKEKAHRVQN